MSSLIDSPEKKAERREIDASAATPVLWFIGSSLWWLVIGTMLGLAVAIKLYRPEFLQECAWVTYGRLKPACWNVLLYGWILMAAWGFAAWLLARLGRIRLCGPRMLVVACHLWNLGVTVGLIGILAGDISPAKWMAFPSYALAVLLTAFLMIAIWLLTMVRLRQPGDTFASQWYLVAALFCFPWLIGGGSILLSNKYFQGVTSALLANFLSSGMIYFVVVPLVLAMLYYLVAQVLEIRLPYYRLAAFAFWLYLTIVGFASLRYLSGGPFPLWLSSTGKAASFLLLIPLTIMVLNLLAAFRDKYDEIAHSKVLTFALVSVLSFTAFQAQGWLMSLDAVNRIMQFTLFEEVHWYLLVFGVAGPALFAAIYYMLPQITEERWSDSFVAKVYAEGTTAGLAILVLGLLAGSMYQGFSLDDPKSKFNDIIVGLRVYHLTHLMGWIVVAVVNLAFLLSYLVFVGRYLRKRATVWVEKFDREAVAMAAQEKAVL